MSADAAAILDFAASLPETGERDYLEDSTIFTFRRSGIGMVSGDGRFLFVKSLLSEREVMIASDPEVYSPWWASGRFGWVRVRLDRIDLDEACELVLEAWRLTAPKKLVRAHEETELSRRHPRDHGQPAAPTAAPPDIP
jgi:hypothetical protein